MNTPNIRTGDTPAALTATQLQQLYTRDSALRNTHADITATLNTLTPGDIRLGRVAVGVTILLLLSSAAAIAVNDNLVGNIIIVALTAIAAIGSLSHTLTHHQARRHRQRIAIELAANNDTYARITRLLNGGLSRAAAREQTAQILHAAAGHTTPDGENDTTRHHRLTHTDIAREHVHLPHLFSDTNNSDLCDIGVDNLMIIFDWPALATHIDHTTEQHENRRSGTHNTRRQTTTVAVLQQLLNTHGADVIATANLLAADDPDRNHHWTDLIDTAATLTPDSTSSAAAHTEQPTGCPASHPPGRHHSHRP
jgi:hypothetical protein